MNEFLDSMIRYWQWADDTAWDIVKGLSDEQFNRTFGESGHSLRTRYIHLAEDSWEWYIDWTGAELYEEPDFESMTREELYEFISTYNKKWADLRATDLHKTLRVGRVDSMVTLTLPQMLFHMNNHATYHRGQIMMTLRLLGVDTTMTDYVPFRVNIGDDE